MSSVISQAELQSTTPLLTPANFETAIEDVATTVGPTVVSSAASRSERREASEAAW